MIYYTVNVMQVVSVFHKERCLGSFNSLRLRQNGRRFLQTMFSNAFSWMKIFEYRLKIHWSLFLRVQLTIFQHWFRSFFFSNIFIQGKIHSVQKLLGTGQATSHYLKQWWLVYWRIFASLGLNELTHCGLVTPYGTIELAQHFSA